MAFGWRLNGAGRAMRGSRNRRPLAAVALLALSMFSCSYGDREDNVEDAKAKRVEVVLPTAGSDVDQALAIFS